MPVSCESIVWYRSSCPNGPQSLNYLSVALVRPKKHWNTLNCHTLKLNNIAIKEENTEKNFVNCQWETDPVWKNEHGIRGPLIDGIYLIDNEPYSWNYFLAFNLFGILEIHSLSWRENVFKKPVLYLIFQYTECIVSNVLLFFSSNMEY